MRKTNDETYAKTGLRTTHTNNHIVEIIMIDQDAIVCIKREK